MRSAESTTSVILDISEFRTSQRCAYSSHLIASYPVSVQNQSRSLAYFSAFLTINHLATCFKTHYHLVFVTLTLWDILLKELYLPFEAHTKNV